MDLVLTYNSDDEMENQLYIKREVKKDPESSDESDGVSIVYEKPASTRLKREIPSDEVMHVMLDSEPETIIGISPIKNEASKKIDYLNLESSDTDDERERIQKNVNNLLSSAAILNDIEYGPIKKESNISTTLMGRSSSSLSTAFVNDSPSTSVVNDLPSTSFAIGHPAVNILSVRVVNSDVNENDTASSICNISDDNIYSQDLSNSGFQSDFITTDCTDGNVSIVEGLKQRIRMYRKDERIVAAYKKQSTCCIPSVLTRRIIAHGKAISSLSWCAVPYSHLFLSSSLDSTVKVWDIYSENNPITRPIQVLNFPLGIRAAKWSKNGEQIMAGGFGKLLHVVDVLSGKTHMDYKVYNYVSCIAIHPFIEDVILCGTQNAIFGFDLRVDSELPVRTFLSKCGEVLDIAFLNKDEFVCSTSVTSHDSADRTIMVWDFNSGAIMSNQIYLERYTCPSLKLTPLGTGFIAQTNGDYIALFSSQKPYKIMNKRYMGHKVSGFGIECDISSDGRYVASGDAKGDVFFYNSGDTTLVKQLTVKRDFATNRLQWHPILPSTMIVATWDGQVQVWK